MSKTFQDLLEESKKLPVMKTWNIYTFLFNLKNTYEEWKTSYALQIEEDYHYTIWEEKIIKSLYIPDHVLCPKAYDRWYKDPHDLKPKELYNQYTEKLNANIKDSIKKNWEEIIQHEDPQCSSRQDVKWIDKDGACELGTLYTWFFNFILYVDDKVIKNVSSRLLKSYDSIKQDTIEEFFDNIQDQYTSSKRVDNQIYIDSYKGYGYEKIRDGIFALFYMDKIGSFSCNWTWFDLRLINDYCDKVSVVNKKDINLTITNWIIKNNNIPIIDFTPTEKNIIKQIWSKDKEWGISKENLMKQTSQTKGALQQSVKVLRGKIKKVWYDDEIISITLKKEACTIQLLSTWK